ncbi:MAG: hypothetical protein AVDCRST_MAG56-4285 [uncultured Cytophagales bacterium]|uniref:Uncharacterized protein n=1 Tax=uncultured Cytophagales bacterium TaxID=158755 RepID=A0A6J4JT96_9SPHI|nr:MAG: hypothetical protein AVDCRST_MAG56-4285 [uncultured Cytophagales bacterium]
MFPGKRNTGKQVLVFNETLIILRAGSTTRAMPLPIVVCQPFRQTHETTR